MHNGGESGGAQGGGAQDIGRLLLRALGYGVAGWLSGALLGFGLGFLTVTIHQSCDTTPDEDTCANGIAMIAFAMATVGMIVAAGMTLIRGMLRLAHIRRTGRDLPFG